MRAIFVQIKCRMAERVQTLPGVADTYTLITFNAFARP